MHPILGEIVGWEALLVLLLIALLFGSSKLPRLARSLGEASHEFRKGVEEGESDESTPPASTPPPATPPAAAPPASTPPTAAPPTSTPPASTTDEPPA
jgi:sec-independent protein translocase protein TatA